MHWVVASEDTVGTAFYLTFDSNNHVATTGTHRVEATHRGSVITTSAGGAVLDDTAEVILPANCIHNNHQGAVPHQMTQHGLLLATEEEWHTDTCVYWSMFHNI